MTRIELIYGGCGLKSARTLDRSSWLGVHLKVCEAAMRSLLLIAIALLLLSPVAAYGDECDAVRPFRTTAEEYQGNFSLSSGIAKRIIGLAGEIDGRVHFREEFPILGNSATLHETQNFYYLVCTILVESDIDAESKLILLSQLRSEASQDMRSVFMDKLQSDDTFEKIEAIDWALSTGEQTYRAVAIEQALNSESPAIKGRLLELFLFGIGNISGTVTTKYKENVSTQSFSIRIDSFERSPAAINFSGSFAGGAFDFNSNRNDPVLDGVAGAIRGNTIHASNKWCSLSARMDDESIAGGTLTCSGKVTLRTGQVDVESGVVEIPVF